MSRRRRIYEGKGKILYEGPEPGTLIQFFKDDTTAFDKQKHEIIDGKGVINNRISEHIFLNLNKMGIPTHFIKRLNMREQLIKEVEIIPLEVVVRNVAAGSIAKRLGIEEGVVLPRSIIEFYYKNDALHDPMVSEEHITAFGWAAPQEIDDIMALAIRVNDFLSGLFLGAGIQLIDFKMECGRLFEGDMMRIVVADEISPTLPPVGRQHKGKDGQGPLPPRHGRAGRSLSGSRAPPRHHERKRAPAPDRAGAGEKIALVAGDRMMRWTFINLPKALLLLLLLAGCTTAPVSGAKDIGYENIGSSGPNRLYVCTGSQCGSLSVIVHRTTAMSPSEASEFETLVNTPTGRKLILRELAGATRGRGDDTRFGPVSKTSIAGRRAAQFSLTFFENGKRDASGHVILILDGAKLQIFAAVNKFSARARSEARQFSQKWAAGSK